MRLWLIPAAYIVASLVCGLTIPRFESSFFPDSSLAISVASAQAFMSATASGMMALTGVVFAMAFVMVQFSAVAYSPRLVLWLARDPLMFHALGTFSATFIYSLLALAWTDRGGSGSVPAFSGMLVGLLLVTSLLLFALLIQRITSLQITNVLFSIGDSGRKVIGEVFGAQAPTQTAAVAELGPVTQSVAYKGAPRAIARIDRSALAELGRSAGGVVVMACAIGDTVIEDTVLLRLHGARQAVDENRLREAVVLRRTRSFEQDPAWAFRLLVDIAIRALSPAVNDPTTAVQTIDQLEDLLRRLEKVHIETSVVCDSTGAVRVLVPMASWDDYLRLAFDEIRHFGSGSIQVMRRLQSALDNLLRLAGTPARAAAVRDYIRLLDQAIARAFPDPGDRIRAQQRDLQGLGISQRFEEAVVPPAEGDQPPAP